MMYKNKDRKGQSLVETALTLPLLLLLIFTFLDLGRAIYFYSALQNSVREGARFAIVTKMADAQDLADLKGRVMDYSVAVDILEEKIIVTPAVYVTGTEAVTVSATYDFRPITPFLARMLGSGNVITLKAESTMYLAPSARSSG